MDVSLTDLGWAVRTHLTPLWQRLHESDRSWGRTSNLPPLMSQAMCRHTTLFTHRLLEAAGHSGWTAVDGVGITARFNRVPGYARERSTGTPIPETGHTWLEHETGILLDLTGDQFGFEPVLIARAGDFRAYRRERKARLSSLRRTILNWEGKEAGTWHEHALKPVRDSYQALLAAARDLRIDIETRQAA